ncbi:MAG: histidine phosphatase family protein [Pseudomonadota bacterium]
MKKFKPYARGTVLHFVRHGATAANLVGLRCGGDLDLPLTDQGRRQAQQVGRALLAGRQPLSHIVTSDLQRTRETATLIAGVIGSTHPLPTLVVEPSFGERRLGDWNLTPTADTEAAMRAGLVPPGGESNDEFHDRIVDALDRIRPLMGASVLVVGSKGVARVLGELSGMPGRVALDNGVLCHFEMGPRFHEQAELQTT